MISAVVPDKSAGDPFTEAMWDTYIKDNLNGLSAGGTSLPASPIDGQVYHYVADATNGIIWQMRYRSASASTYKWEWVGGGELRAELRTTGSTTSTSYVDLPGAGLSLVAPRAGDYLVNFHVVYGHTVGTAFGIVAVKVGGAAVDEDNHGLLCQTEVANCNVVQNEQVDVLAVAASTTLKMQYRTASNTMTFNNEAGGASWMTLRPLRFI